MVLFRNNYLHTPELSELLRGGEVRAAHALPQLVWVGNVIVHVVGDVQQTWITNRY